MRWFPEWPHKRCPTGCRNRASNMATWNICILKRTWNIISNLPANSAFLPWQFDMTVLTLIHDRRRTYNAKHKRHWLPTSKITYVLPLPPLTSLELFEVWAPCFALLGRYSNINHIVCGKKNSYRLYRFVSMSYHALQSLLHVVAAVDLLLHVGHKKNPMVRFTIINHSKP